MFLFYSMLNIQYHSHSMCMYLFYIFLAFLFTLASMKYWILYWYMCKLIYIEYNDKTYMCGNSLINRINCYRAVTSLYETTIALYQIFIIEDKNGLFTFNDICEIIKSVCDVYNEDE